MFLCQKFEAIVTVFILVWRQSEKKSYLQILERRGLEKVKLHRKQKNKRKRNYSERRISWIGEAENQSKAAIPSVDSLRHVEQKRKEKNDFQRTKVAKERNRRPY